MSVFNLKKKNNIIATVFHFGNSLLERINIYLVVTNIITL